MTLFSIAFMLFLIMDPVGNVSSYLNLVNELPRKRQRWIVIREMLIALAFMLLFNAIGEYIFNILQISHTVVRLSSGLILFLVAIKILFPSVDSPRANLPKGEPFVIPLAIPLIAGPSLLATIMLYAHEIPGVSLMVGAIFLAWLAASVVLLASPYLKKALGNNGLMACERLMGMILILLAIQRFAEGVQLFVKST
ncbi:MAG: MarC family protein [Parachlamydiaceae bacterium]